MTTTGQMNEWLRSPHAWTGWISKATTLSLLFSVGGVSTTVNAASQAEAESPNTATASCRLVWSDEFDEPGLPDPEKWSYNVGGHGWGNDELQYYTEARPENARVEDGHLVIEARKENWEGRDYTSARLVSKQEWTYGRFEARAKLPSGRGTWPAIWMLPDLEEHGGWPLGGEIDIMEHVGHNPDVVHSTVHTAAYNHSIGTHHGAHIEVPDARSGFNVYAVEWTPEEIRGYVNDKHYFTFENERRRNPKADERHWPFDHPFHYVLNIAVGGGWGGQEGVDPDIWPQRMVVDYVRTYNCHARPEITHGPTLGRVDQEHVGVWVRTSLPATFEVVYRKAPQVNMRDSDAVDGNPNATPDGNDGTADDSNKASLEQTTRSERGQTELAHDNTGWVLLDGLEPGTRYEYEVRVGEWERSGSFHTLPSRAAHRNPEYNPEGLFNFSFEYGACNFQYEQPDGSREMPAYKTMVEELVGEVDFQIMNGDFIYEAGRRTTVEEWADDTQTDTIPPIVETAPEIVGVWENYKIYFDRSTWLSQWHSHVPAFFMFDDHELLNDINGTADPGVRDRRTLFRDVGVQAWRDYVGWSNPLPAGRGTDVHFGRADISPDGILHDPKADFRLDPATAPTLHVHWSNEHPARGVYDIVEVVGPDRLRIAPAPDSGGLNLPYSIAMSNFYDFRVANGHFFVLDTRSHRNMHDRAEPAKEGISMIGDEQRDWLTSTMRQSDADFFFVVSTVSFAIPHVDPNDPEKDESWTAYLDEREKLFDFWDGLDQPVMLLTGDLHNSAAIRVSDNIHEFLAGHHNSPNHYAKHEAHRPPSGEFEYEGRTVDILWSTYFLDDVPRIHARKPHYTVVKVKNVFSNPTTAGERWVVYPRPQVVFEYHDGLTGELMYAHSISPGD